MMKAFLRRASKADTEDQQIREIDERHFLSQQVFFRREALRITQTELAEAAGMTQSQIANIEAGHANPTFSTLSKLAFALGCFITDLTASNQPYQGCDPVEEESINHLIAQVAPRPTEWERMYESATKWTFLVVGEPDFRAAVGGRNILQATMDINSIDVSFDATDMHEGEFDFFFEGAVI